MKLSDFRRIGAAVLMAIGVLAPSIGIEIGPEDAEKAVGAFDNLLTAGSAFVAIILVLWSKVASWRK